MNDGEAVPVHPLPSTEISDGFRLNTVQRVYAKCYPENIILFYRGGIYLLDTKLKLNLSIF
jgi:hypothetical protein